MKHIEKLDVLFNDQMVGQLTFGNKGKIYFTYDSQWLKQGFNVSPFDLKMNDVPQLAKDNLFGGLHGIFADSISDGWGLLLTDRALQKKFDWEKNSITQLDRLFFIGNRAMGGLKYKPASHEENKDNSFDLESIALETQKIVSGEKEEIIKDLYLTGGSPGGARPKAVFSRQGSTFCSGYDVINPGYEAWMVKFFSQDDNEDNGKIEKAYADMAADCGLVMPKTELLEIKINKKKYSFFAIERFDREGNHRVHTASLSGLVYASHRLPSLSYKEVLTVSQRLCHHKDEVEQTFNLMLFNIIMHNKDDHTKNFAYIHKGQQWLLSPAYDLTFSSALGNEHMTDLYGNGNPGAVEVAKIAKEFDIKSYQEKVDRFLDISSKWMLYAEKYAVSHKEALAVEKSLDGIRKSFTANVLKKARKSM